MNKYLIGLFVNLYSLNAMGSIFNVLVIDSSFSPIEFQSGKVTPEKCLLLNENNIEVPKSGNCYNISDWNGIKESEIENLKGFQDILSGNKESKAALSWKKISKKLPNKSRLVRNNYIVSVHGSRSAYIIDKFSEGKSNILYMRNLTSGIGGVKIKTKGRSKNYKKYSNGCGLYNWAEKEILEFSKGRNLQPYQERISRTLQKNKKIRLVNISLGYKKSWIKEDNPVCNDEQISKEFNVLTQSWNNLISMFPNVLFFVAAGNENENFDNPVLKNNDLWPLLSSMKLSNLVLVGSIYENGNKFRSSNYGKLVRVMALGNNIKIASALPGNIKGHITTVRGTSFTTPLVVGTAVKLLNSKIDIHQLKKKIVNYFFKRRKEKLEKSFISNCDKVSRECFTTIVSLLSGPFLWNETNELFLKGKKSWGYLPFPIEYVENLGSAAKLKVEKFKDIYLPKLLIGKITNPYDLLLTLHHEIYHYSQIKGAFKYFYQKDKIRNCVTQYQLSLAKDERQAFLAEIEFYKNAPKWFEKGVKALKINSRLLSENGLHYDDYYKILDSKIKKDPNFIVNRYIELGEYPLCMKALF